MLGWIFKSHLFTHKRKEEDAPNRKEAAQIDAVDARTCPYLGVPMDAIVECRVVDVYDGDTITVILPFAGSFYKSKIRLLGVDTPEIKTTNADEKAAALKARDWVRDQVLNRHAWLHCKGPDKYGRLLANVYPTAERTESVNDMLVRLNYGKRYDGGTKSKFVSSEAAANA